MSGKKKAAIREVAKGLLATIDAPMCDHATGLSHAPDAGECAPNPMAVEYGTAWPCGDGFFLCYAHAKYWASEMRGEHRDEVKCATCERAVGRIEWMSL
ncbi:hypothetical protein [Microbacterium sp.]|uniref:hypothetical protein n=1 Tax=Microbacterium sp. TaxID=51671 RepID=UPI003C754D5B